MSLRVTLSEPIAIGRSRGYFWFPNLWPMPNGDLLATISPVADIHMSSIPYLVTWSRDGGLTWSEPIVTNDGGQTLLQRVFNGRTDHTMRQHAMVAAVAHREFMQRHVDDFAAKIEPGGLYVDVKCKADAAALRARGVRVWRL